MLQKAVRNCHCAFKWPILRRDEKIYSNIILLGLIKTRHNNYLFQYNIEMGIFVPTQCQVMRMHDNSELACSVQRWCTQGSIFIRDMRRLGSDGKWRVGEHFSPDDFEVTTPRTAITRFWGTLRIFFNEINRKKRQFPEKGGSWKFRKFMEWTRARY